MEPLAWRNLYKPGLEVRFARRWSLHKITSLHVQFTHDQILLKVNFLSAAWRRLSGAYVENLPRLDCAERYDRTHRFHYMDQPYWQTAGCGIEFAFENYERMADFMRRSKGKVMVSINDHPDIREVFEGFHFETVNILYSIANQRQGKADLSGEL